MAVLVALDRAGVALGRKVQESVSKVRRYEGRVSKALHLLSIATRMHLSTGLFLVLRITCAVAPLISDCCHCCCTCVHMWHTLFSTPGPLSFLLTTYHHPSPFSPTPTSLLPSLLPLLLPPQFVADALPRFSPPVLAGLLACNSSLGLGSTPKLLRRAATEYQRRPEPHPSVDMLLGLLGGLASGGRDFIRDLPQQLLTR